MEKRSKLVGENSNSIPNTKSGMPKTWLKIPFLVAYSFVKAVIYSLSLGLQR